MSDKKVNQITLISDKWLQVNTDNFIKLSVQITEQISNLRDDNLISRLDEFKILTLESKKNQYVLKSQVNEKKLCHIFKEHVEPEIIEKIEKGYYNYFGLKEYWLIKDSYGKVRLTYDNPTIVLCQLKKGKNSPRSGCILTLITIAFPIIYILLN